MITNEKVIFNQPETDTETEAETTEKQEKKKRHKKKESVSVGCVKKTPHFQLFERVAFHQVSFPPSSESFHRGRASTTTGTRLGSSSR